MPRYIDADALLVSIQPLRSYTAECIKYQIRNAPTISLDEVRGVGEWIPLNYSDEFYGDMYQCSNCGGSTIGEPGYCECCGARMKGTEDGATD